MDLQGRTLDGRYQLGSVLGVGGMASVYLAHDRVLERRVAVKVLSPPYGQDPAFVERFRREARSAARLSHPNVVAVFDSGSDAGLHYLVMEYVAGESLAELLARQGRLAPRRPAELPSRCVRRWPPRTPRGWCTATSSPATCCSMATGG
jgi:eukaryotic-like serine/threonine-protein kinase